MQRVYSVVWRCILSAGQYSAMGYRLPSTIESIKIAYDVSGLTRAFRFAEFLGFARAMDNIYLNHQGKK